MFTEQQKEYFGKLLEPDHVKELISKLNQHAFNANFKNQRVEQVKNSQYNEGDFQKKVAQLEALKGTIEKELREASHKTGKDEELAHFYVL
mmetsp:Transcript_25574/g.24867  ORF Transcript_25574/g.24867 Transcript_25574/m.24867 type:complete len:91 (+) Transcript_25574:296-568(+)